MCTGLELAAMAASVGGGVLQRNEANRQAQAVVDAQNQQLSDFQARNAVRQTQAQDAFHKLTAALQPDQANAAQQDSVANRTTQIAPNVAPVAAPSAAPLRGSGESLIGGVYKKADNAAAANAAQRAAALAQTGGITDAMFNRGIDAQNTGLDVGNIVGQAQSDAQLLPSYQQMAGASASAKHRPSGIGSLLQGLGLLGGMYAGHAAAAAGAR